jgi:hypothetical protein
VKVNCINVSPSFGGLNVRQATETATDVTKAILRNSSDFFKSVLNDNMVRKYLMETPALQEFAQTSGVSVGKIHPEVYDMLAGHNQGIVDLTQMYLKTMGVNPTQQQLDIAKASALAHDVGKTFASAEIWNQKGVPTGYLKHFIDNHTVCGALVTRQIGAPEEINIFTRLHHSTMGEMQTELLKAHVSNPKTMSDIFEAMKGADIRQALRAENDALRMYRQQPLDWFKTHVFTNDEVFKRNRLRPDVYKAVTTNDFGPRPTKQYVYKMLEDDYTKGYFPIEDTRNFLIERFGVKKAKGASHEGILQICTNILYKMIGKSG